ncbi:MAG: lysophospholipid acyltransferase family protein [Verrucomicrobiota bacterium]
MRWFTGVARRRIRSSFHEVRLSKTSAIPDSDSAVVLYGNHPSWWDPLVGLIIRDVRFPERMPFTPIDAEMLHQYGILSKIGFFGIEPSGKGARRFLRITDHLFQSSSTLLMVTPQGRFADVRERPLELQRGLSLVAQRAPDIQFLPIALEYPFWEESKPEILIHLGPVWRPGGMRAKEAHQRLTQSLEDAQDTLAQLSISRDANAFDLLLRGSSSQDRSYDAWRRFRSWLRGESAEIKHGKL